MPVTTVSGDTADLAALKALVRESEIDFGELTGNVNAIVSNKGPATIAEILETFPATQGVASIVGLVALAERHGVRTSTERTEQVWWTPVTRDVGNVLGTTHRHATVPEYLFEEAIT